MNANHTPNTIFAGALVSGALTLFTAGSLVAAPVVNADIDFECKPGCWGALAASPSNGQEEIVTNATTQQKAEDRQGRLVVRRTWQDERLLRTHIGTGLSCARGEQRRENVGRANRAHARRG
jgi:hypothetical protein